MPSTSIILSDKPRGPGDEAIFRKRIQKKRTDPEAKILKEYKELVHKLGPKASEEKIFNSFCERLGGITGTEFCHKLEIFYGFVDDDEKELREKKYGEHPKK